MISTRKQAANLLNAQKSTGPASELGKTASSMNALSHGLSAQTIYDAETTERIDTLAKEFLDPTKKDDVAMDFAREAADAQLQLQKIRILKIHIWKLKMPPKEKMTISKILSIVAYSGVPAPDELDKLDISETAKQLQTLVRYERQFSNRRDRALRALTEYVSWP